jgi:hypothetical protein
MVNTCAIYTCHNRSDRGEVKRSFRAVRKIVLGQGEMTTGTCFIQKIYAPPSSLLQEKYLPFSPSPSPLRLNIFRLFVILSLTQLYRYTPAIFLFLTATFKYTYRAPLRWTGQEYSANIAWSTFQSLKQIQPLPVCAGFFICIRNSLDRHV